MKKSINLKTMILVAFLCSTIMMNAQNNQNNKINYDRPYDKAGLNMFETTKEDLVPFTGFQIKLSGGFTQQYQALKYS